jgi:cell pole-organizing protein PopZ
MSQAAKAPEPSMEEILASIRRIIAEDDSEARGPEPAGAAIAPPPKPPEAGAPAAVAPQSAPAGQDEIDAMISEMEQASPKPNGKAPHDSADVLKLTESLAAPPAQPPVFRTEGLSDVFPSEMTAGQPHRSSRALAESALMSSATSAAVDAAFNTLAQTVMAQNSRTLEDLVAEMMRPMLKAWLDDNLPGLVERVVRAEIERVSRGR